MLKIAEIRKEKGITQKKLAELLGIYQSNMSNWETGITEPDMQSLIKLADILEVSVDYMLGRENELGFVNINNNLTPFQNKLLDVVNKLSRDDQFQVLGFAQALAH